MKQAILFLTMFFSIACPAQTIEQVAKELVRQGVPHSKIVLAQARLESGNMKSETYKRTYNLFGIKHNGRHAKYSHWRESIKDYKERISSRYNGKENYYRFLVRIKYAEEKTYIQKVKKIANGMERH